MKVHLVAKTTPVVQKDLTLDQLMAYVARVSNPRNQMNLDTMSNLLHHCLRERHWSVFEVASLTFEIVDIAIPIASQLLRHRSATFQQTSRRYSSDPVSLEADNMFVIPEFRRQAKRNRQASEDGAINPEIFFGVNQALEKDPSVSMAFSANDLAMRYLALGEELYNSLLNAGVSRETARLILPQAASTRIYMTNNVRGWLHFIAQRDSPHAQKEIRDVAKEIKSLLMGEIPVTMQAAEQYIYSK